MDAPSWNVISGYKWEFLRRRLLQTAVGGPRLWLPFRAPAYVPSVQLLLWLLPAAIGAPLAQLVPPAAAAAGCGATVGLLSLLLQILAVVAVRRDAGQQVKTSVLAQDDEVEFTGLFHWSTWRFIVPAKRRLANVLFHPALGGLTAAAATYTLADENMTHITSMGVWLAVVLRCLGWLSVCACLYSVCVARPPEPAVLLASTSWELAALYRPLYLLATTLPLLVLKLAPAPSATVEWLDVAARLVLCLLPLLWLAGVLPSWEVALAWIGEQIMVLVCGGSACSSRRRLLLQLLAAGCQLAVLTLLVSRQHRLWAAAVSGYLLSADAVGALRWLYRYLVQLPSRRPPPRPGWWRPLLHHSAALTAAAGTAGLCTVVTAPPGALPALAAVLAVAGLARAATVELQRVYSCGLWRSRLYRPPGRDGGGAVLRQMALWIHILVVPLLLSLYLGWEVSTSAASQPEPVTRSAAHALRTICLARAYRWLWQNPDAALLESVCVCALRLLLPAPAAAAAAGWPELQLALASLVRDRLCQLAQKLYCPLVLMAGWMKAKERRRAHLLLGINVAIMPLSIITLLLSCAFATPLLPLCTLPLLIPTFPRRLSWPSRHQPPPEALMSTPDAVYYHQMAGQTAERLGNAIWTGRAGFVQPGDYYLLRFDDRLMWVYVAERGNSYLHLVIKGLELQGTSCHAAEATRVDTLFDAAFDQYAASGAGGADGGGGGVSHDWMHTLAPLTQIQVLGYSDARSQLTGVIDSSDTLEIVEQLFPRVVAYLLIQHCLSPASVSPSRLDAAAGADKTETGGGGGRLELPRHDSTERYRTALSTPVPPLVPSELGDWSDSGSAGSLLFEQKKRGTVVPVMEAAPWLQQVLADVPEPAAAQLQRRSTGAGLPPIHTSSTSPPTVTVSLAGSPSRRGSRRMSSARVAPLPSTTVPSPPSATPSATRRQSRPAWEPLLPPLQSAPSALAVRLAPPELWSLTAPRLRQQLSEGVAAEFWTAAAQRLLPAGDEPAGILEQQLGGPTALVDISDKHRRIVRLVDAAYHATRRELGVRPSPDRVHTMYQEGPSGEAPETGWLRSIPELLALASQAYRWSVKLALDAVLLGGFDSDAELLEALDELRTSWFIGLECEPGWRRALLGETPRLFALGYDDDKRVYTSHLLTLGEQTVAVGRLSAQMVRAIWASAGLELLYVTNDDDERFSIQADEVILRNLTVQAADPPLGYPVYTSVPLLSTAT